MWRRHEDRERTHEGKEEERESGAQNNRVPTRVREGQRAVGTASHALLRWVSWCCWAKLLAWAKVEARVELLVHADSSAGRSDRAAATADVCSTRHRHSTQQRDGG